MQSKRVDAAFSWTDLTKIFSHGGSERLVDVPTRHGGKLLFAFVHFENAQDTLSTLQRAARGEFKYVTMRTHRACGQAARAGAGALVA